jgi:hypothetical protein
MVSFKFLVYIISSYFQDRTFEASFQTATLSLRDMLAAEARSSLISPVFCKLYINDMIIPTNHVELALYAEDTTIIVTSRKPTLLVTYLELYLNKLKRWLSGWRNVIYISKSTMIIFAQAGRRFIRPVY